MRWEILRNLASADANHRGFLLAAHTDFLARLERARTHTLSAVARAEALTQDNAGQQARFPAVRPGMLTKFEEMQVLLDERRNRGHAAGPTRLPTARGARANEELECQIAMTRIVENGLLAYGRLEREEMRLAPVDLGACIDQVLQEIATEIAARDTEVEVSRPFGHVLAQRTTVQQVLISFITDDLKFLSKGTRPRVRL